MFHPKRGRRRYRNCPQPPHRLCPPQVGSRQRGLSRRPSRGPHRNHYRRLGRPPQRDGTHSKRGRRSYRNRHHPPHRLGPPQLGSRRPRPSRRPSRGPNWNHHRRCRGPPQRDVFHPKRWRRRHRTGPQPSHRLCPPQLGSRFHHLRPSRRPSHGPRLYHWRRCSSPPQRDVFHPKRGRRTYRTGPQPPHHLCLPQVGSTPHYSPCRPSRSPHRNQGQVRRWHPQRAVFHPKRGRRNNRNSPQPPHHLCLPQVGSMSH